MTFAFALLAALTSSASAQTYSFHPSAMPEICALIGMDYNPATGDCEPYELALNQFDLPEYCRSLGMMYDPIERRCVTLRALPSKPDIRDPSGFDWRKGTTWTMPDLSVMVAIGDGRVVIAPPGALAEAAEVAVSEWPEEAASAHGFVVDFYTGM